MAKLDQVLEAGSAVVKDTGIGARALDEVTRVTAKLLGRSAKDASTGVTVSANDFIQSAVARGDLPAGLYSDTRKFGSLTDPRTVKVDHIYFSNNWVALRRDAEASEDGFRTNRVILNREPVGIFDRKSSLGNERFPLKFRSVNIHLTDGRSFSFPERDVPVITQWNHVGGRSWPDKGMVLSAAPVDISPFTKLTFANAKDLQKGSPLITEFPFQPNRTGLTNGVETFPLRAPDDNWKYPQLSRLPDEYYQQLLKALDGKTLKEASLPQWATLDENGLLKISDDALLSERKRAYVPDLYIAHPERVFTKKPYFGSLEGGKSVTVEGVEIRPHQVSLGLERDGEFFEHNVQVDGRRVGGFDPSDRRSLFPLTINSATVRLSDGRAMTVSDRDLAVVKDWAPVDYGAWIAQIERPFTARGLSITPYDQLKFNEVKDLKPGTTFHYDYPFQPVGKNLLSNGRTELEIRRPAYGNGDLPEEKHQKLIDALRGHHLDDAQLPPWVHVSASGRFEYDPKVVIREREVYDEHRPIDEKAEPEKPKALIRRLKDGEGITVTSVKLSEHQLSLKLDPRDGHYLDHGVYLNGKRVGGFDSNGGLNRADFPRTVHVAEVKFSNGEKKKVIDTNLTVITKYGKPHSFGDGLEEFTPRYKRLFADSAMRVNPWQALSYDQVAALKPGTFIAQRYPFQWVGDTLTNGMISLPRIRPVGSEWRDIGVPAVDKGYYDSYLKSLDGKFVDDVKARHRLILDGIKAERAAAERPLTPRQRQLEAVVNGQMWDGKLAGQAIERVSLSEGVMFKFPVGKGKELYVVDNPRAGAIYLFKHYKEAEKVATGYRTIKDAMAGRGARMNARDAGHRFIIHTGEWKQKLHDAIIEMRDELIG